MTRNLAGEFLSFFAAIFAFVLVLLWVFSFQRDQIFALARDQVEDIFSNTVPDFTLVLDNIYISPDRTNSRWVRVENIELYNPKTDERIEIGRLRFTFDPIGLITGRPNLSGLTVDGVDLNILAKGRRPEEILASIFAATDVLGQAVPLRPGSIARVTGLNLTLHLPTGEVRPVFRDARAVYSYDEVEAGNRQGNYHLAFSAKRAGQSRIAYRATVSAFDDQVSLRGGVDIDIGTGTIENSVKLVYDRNLDPQESTIDDFADALHDIDGYISYTDPNNAIWLDGQLSWDGEWVNIAPLTVLNGSARLSARLDVTPKETPLLDGVIHELSYPSETGRQYLSGGVSGRLLLNPRKVIVQNTYLNFRETDVIADMAGFLGFETGLGIGIATDIRNADAADLVSVWPRGQGAGGICVDIK